MFIGLIIISCLFVHIQALLEYEKHKIRTGELQIPESSIPEPTPDNRLVIQYELVGYSFYAGLVV